jgi:hypothetical protein
VNDPMFAKEVATTLKGPQGYSRHAICSSADPEYLKFTSVDFAELPPHVEDYFFYNISNPSEYLHGEEDAEVREQGPYVLQ